MYTSGALAKLLVFSVALGVAPLSSYYLSQNYLWNGARTKYYTVEQDVDAYFTGNSTYAAITAVALANVVLVIFIVMSVIDEKRGADVSAKTQPKPETKKTK